MRTRLDDVALWMISLATFIESCSIPNVPHGKIGIYEEHQLRLPIYKELSKGANIKDGSDLYLSCEGKYEPFGTTEIEVKFHCNRGEWDRYPRCEPAICRMPPPQAAHATLRKAASDRSHGAVVVYVCKRYFIMSKYGNVTCQFGTWKGNTPICKDTFFSIKKPDKHYYKSHDGFIPICETGFTALKPNNMLTCFKGEWKGLEPLPCTPANCSDEPPKIENGQFANFSRHHTSEVTYTCNEFFILKDSDSKVECKFGKWIGRKPTCQEKPCAVPKIPNGNIGKYEKHNQGLPVYKKLPEGTKIEDGTELYLSCKNKYEPFGTKNPEEKINCSHGEWNRYPRCDPAICRMSPPQTLNAHIRRSTFSRSHGAAARYDCNTYFTKSKFGNVTCQFGTWKGNTPTCKDTRCDTNSLASFSIRKIYKRYYKSNETLTPICKTGFTARKANNRLMCLNGEWKGLYPLPCTPANCSNEPPKIENGHVVNFTRHHSSEVTYTCNEFFVLNGSYSKVQCKFGKWIGKKPTCQNHGQNKYCSIPNVPHGKIGKYKRHHVRLPIYKELSKGTKVTDGSNLYLSCEGKYEPFGTTETEEKIHCNRGVWDRYPRCEPAICRMPPPKAAHATLRKIASDRSHGAIVVYVCKRYFIMSKYGNVTCQFGTWKGNTPICKDTRCDTNSLDSFSIRKRYKRYYRSNETLTPICKTGFTAIKPNNRLMCLKGEWKGLHPIPCTPVSACKWYDLIKMLPDYIDFEEIHRLQKNDAPYGFSLNLKCDANRRLIGKSDKAKCKYGGKWKIEKIKCVVFCTPVEKLPDSDIIIDSEKEFYRIGEVVTFSCPPGQMLSTEVYRIMCLPMMRYIGRGLPLRFARWSYEVMPTCVNRNTDNYGEVED